MSYLRTGLPPGANRFLPLTRLAFKTFLPPTLDIRVRKPETLARFLLVPNSVTPRPFLLLASTTSV